MWYIYLWMCTIWYIFIVLYVNLIRYVDLDLINSVFFLISGKGTTHEFAFYAKSDASCISSFFLFIRCLSH